MQSTWIMCALITNHIIASTLLNFSQICARHSITPFTDTIGMNEMCCKLNPTCHKNSVTSLIKQIFFMVNSENSSIILFSVKHVEDYPIGC